MAHVEPGDAYDEMLDQDQAMQEYFQRLDPRTRMTPAEEDELALWLDHQGQVHLAPEGGETEAA